MEEIIDEYIETQISLARAEMKAQCLAVIPEETYSDIAHENYTIDRPYNLALKHCRQNISSLPVD